METLSGHKVIHACNDSNAEKTHLKPNILETNLETVEQNKSDQITDVICHIVSVQEHLYQDREIVG